MRDTNDDFEMSISEVQDLIDSCYDHDDVELAEYYEKRIHELAASINDDMKHLGIPHLSVAELVEIDREVRGAER